MEKSFRNNCSIDNTNRKQGIIIQWQNVVSNSFFIFSVLSLIYINISFSLIAISLILTYLYGLQKLNQSLTQMNQLYGVINQEIPRLDRIIEFYKNYNKYIEKEGTITQPN